MKTLMSILHYVPIVALFTVCPAIFGGSPAASQATFRVVSYLNQIQGPVGLTEGSPGVFFSIAGGGGQPALFSVDTHGAKKVLATFPSGSNLSALLVSAANGRFYSAVQVRTNPANVVSVASAPGTKKVYAPQNLLPLLTQNLPDGRLLGIAVALSSNPWYLAICDPAGNVAQIYTFPSGERLPITALYASDGNYYGVSYLPDTSGYLYRVTPAGVPTKLKSFPKGTFLMPSYAPLLQGTDGNLYGATPTGGANGTGTVYKLTLGGDYTLLYTFPSGGYYQPTSLIQASDGNLYGSTLGVGSQLFRVTTSGQYTLLYTMALGPDGQCQCQLVQGSDGTIYGTAIMGGMTGAGDVFALNVGLAKPAPGAQRFTPESGAAGTQVLIWGSNLLSAAVEFNGVPASSVANSGSNYVITTVPAGATTGPITITTPGGTTTTTASFMVN